MSLREWRPRLAVVLGHMEMDIALPSPPLPPPPPDSDTKQQAMRVMVVSPGGTATRTLFFLLCELGYPVVHSLAECNGGSTGRRSGGHVVCSLVSAPTFNGWYGKYLGVAERGRVRQCRGTAVAGSKVHESVHDALQKLWRVASSCSQATSPATAGQTCSTRAWAASVERSLVHLQASSYSLTDTPYASFPTALARHWRQSRGGHQIIISERPALEWARSSQSTTPWDPVCQPRLWSLVPDPLDLLECALACRDAALGGCLSPVRALPVLTLAAAFNRSRAHLDVLFGDAALRINLFRPGRERTPLLEVKQLLRQRLLNSTGGAVLP